MKLSVVTITCRANPRFKEMADTLFTSFRRAATDAVLQWIIVDDKLWTQDGNERLAPVIEIYERLPADVRARIEIQHFPPPPTAHRSPDLSDPLPAHNSARNAALAVVEPESYVVFLSDCTVVSADWVTVALDVASKNLGWRCQLYTVHDLPMPCDGTPFRYRDAHDNLHPVVATTVAGPCWGVPAAMLVKIGGFDADYDGEDDMTEHEALIRLQRVGVSFVTTKRATCVRMRRSKLKADVTTREDAIRSKRNQMYYGQLVRDRQRILPGAQQVAASSRGLGGARPAPAPAVLNPDLTETIDLGPVDELPEIAAPRPAARPVASLAERARALQEQRRQRAADAAAGKPEVIADGERCGYTPTQGRFKEQPCILRQRHGGAHRFDEASLEAPTAAAAPTPPPRPSREPPAPTADQAKALVAVDDYIQAALQVLEGLAFSPARMVATLFVLMLRDGIVMVEQQVLRALEDMGVPAGELQQHMSGWQGILPLLPRFHDAQRLIPLLRQHHEAMEQWRLERGLDTHAAMAPNDLMHAIALELNYELATPDDFGDANADEVAALERAAVNAAGDDDIVSVEPLSEEEAEAQRLAAERLAAEESARGSAPEPQAS